MVKNRVNIVEKDGDLGQHINKKNYTIDTLDIPDQNHR